MTHMTDKLTVVVSRYNEDTQWLNNIQGHKIIFNKGNKIADNCIALPNIGRETHTLCHYLYNFYDELNDYTLFLQGNPFEHMHCVNDLYAFIEHFETADEVMGLGIYMSDAYHLNSIKKIEDYLNIDKKTNMFYTNSQYLIPRKNIVKRNREFYKKLLELHYADVADVVIPDVPWVLERMWWNMFKN